MNSDPETSAFGIGPAFGQLAGGDARAGEPSDRRSAVCNPPLLGDRSRVENVWLGDKRSWGRIAIGVEREPDRLVRIQPPRIIDANTDTFRAGPAAVAVSWSMAARAQKWSCSPRQQSAASADDAGRVARGR